MEEDFKNEHAYQGLEPQQYQRLYFEDDVPVKDLRHGVLLKLFYFAMGLFILLLTMAAVARYPDQIELPFTLKTMEQESIYKFPFPVFIYEYYKTSGDSVSPGDKLIRISSPEIVEMIYALADSRSKRDLFDKFGNEVQDNKRKIIQTSIQQNRIKSTELKKQLQNLKQNWFLQSLKLAQVWQDASVRLEAYKKLHTSGISSTFEYKDHELNEIRARENLNTANNNFYLDSTRLVLSLQQLDLDIKTAEAEISNIRLQAEGDRTQLINTLSLNQQKLLHSFGPFDIMDGDIILKSSHAGVISYLYDGEKEIKSGNTLLKISSLKRPDYAFMKCPPGLAGKIKTGQESHLKILSFPFYEWGTVKALVDEVSQSPDEQGMYNVKLSFTEAGKLRDLLIPGLSGSAIILIDEKTLLQYFFRKVNKGYHQFLEGKQELEPTNQ